MKKKCTICFRSENAEKMQQKEKVILQTGKHTGEIATAYKNDFGVIEMDIAFPGLSMALPFNVSVKDEQSMMALKQLSLSKLDDIEDLIGAQTDFDIAVIIEGEGYKSFDANIIESISGSGAEEF
jgi:hypothetical protein